MKPELSILMPAIRPNNWMAVYNSILKSYSGVFELIIISPYPLPKEMDNISNIKYIKSFSNPVRATQIGLLYAEGKYIYPTHADDAYLIEGALDKNIELLVSMGDYKDNIVVCKYSESRNLEHPDRYQNDDYYKIVNAYAPGNHYIPKDWWIFNTVIMHTEFLFELGGYDCSYTACPYAHADLACRAQIRSATVQMSPYPLIRCDHGQDDHGPIEHAQLGHDAPLFHSVYCKPLNTVNPRIDLNNWQNAPAVWSLRFK